MNRIRNCLFAVSIALVPAIVPAFLHADKPAPAPASRPATDPVILQIRREGLEHSQVEQTLDYLCNVIGQRLTASPSQKRASEWTRDTLAKWGLSNAHLEPWGPFGRGWSMEQFSFQVTEPYAIVLQGFPKAWSPGFDAPLNADLVYLDAKTKTDLLKYQGKLKGKIVLIGTVHTPEPHFKAQAERMSAEDLSKLVEAGPDRPREMLSSTTGPATRPGAQEGRDGRATSRPSPLAQNAAMAFFSDQLSFAAKEGAAVIVDASRSGDGGTYFVQSASVPAPATQPTTLPATTLAATALPTAHSTTQTATTATTAPTTRPRAWAVDAPVIPAQITLATEDFNRLVRMLNRGQQLKAMLNLKVKFYPLSQVMTCNTIAEIPGSDLKDQVVMVGAHLDSWHSGTGATDNGVGSACAMEAVRIIRSLNLHPRRTIRVALWTGEEQGIFGSSAYVKQHFGSLPDEPATTGPTTSPTTMRVSRPTVRSLAGLVKLPEYEKLSVYFNLDNGTGKIRGVYAQGNSEAMPLFREWLAPFADLDATTLTLSNTGSTDHIPFDRIGLPGFQFIQDPIEYGTRTHHSNEDVFDRIQIEDMKQASTIMAACLWDAANMDQRFPRKPSR